VASAARRLDQDGEIVIGEICITLWDFIEKDKIRRLLRLHLDRSCWQDPGPPRIRLQRINRRASLELRLDLCVQRRHLVAGLLAIRTHARPRPSGSMQSMKFRPERSLNRNASRQPATSSVNGIDPLMVGASALAAAARSM
jgi:hypothetical protein